MNETEITAKEVEKIDGGTEAATTVEAKYDIDSLATGSPGFHNNLCISGFDKDQPRCHNHIDRGNLRGVDMEA
jgi:hypothetical protein